ncbi:MAG: SpoIIE family protein phosphatase [Flavobacteriales bacterium]|nr:SpoIIE family protein phosphatase [Flavobacteriales bacterium]
MSEKLSYEELLQRYDELQDSFFQMKQKYIGAARELDQRNEQLAEHHKELSDSINYALRIQMAILPPDYMVKKCLPKSFIFYKPKDVVSGDFYFVEKRGNKVIFSAVDCTGHGVPGAMMSVIGFKYLEQGVNEKGITDPAELLQFLDIGVNDSLRQTADESGVKDGMDLGICTLDMDSNILQFAGAFNPVWIIPTDNDKFLALNKERIENEERITSYCCENGKCLYAIAPDRLPIGVNEDGEPDVFMQHELQMDKNDIIYLFSDGYADQFGGPNDKKFMHKKMRELLMSIHDRSMTKQKEALNERIKMWMGNTDQIDDILVMGVRV